MRKARATLAIIALLVAEAAPSGHAAAAGGLPVHVGRAFTASAEAHPVEAAPGTQDTAIAVQPAATKVVASNPPLGAYGRASLVDLGLAEAQFGQVGPSAEADTATAEGDDDVVVADAGGRMEVHVDPAPKASASATGSEAGGSGIAASTSTADGSAAHLVATATAEVHDLTIGPFVLGSGRFEARAEIDGTPGGGRAEGLIRMLDVAFEGIPITIGDDGVRVDESRVPDPLLGEATAAIHEAFAPGGFADIRVVQPKVEVAPDGTSARVHGGSVRLYFTNNDPVERYFVSSTLLAGTAEVALGGALSQATPDRLPGAAPAPAVPPVAPAAATASAVAPPLTTAPGGPPAPPAPALAFAQGTERVSLRVPWPGWAWVLVLLAIGWATVGALRLPPLAATKRRLDDVVDDLADRYLRG